MTKTTTDPKTKAQHVDRLRSRITAHAASLRDDLVKKYPDLKDIPINTATLISEITRRAAGYLEIPSARIVIRRASGWGDNGVVNSTVTNLDDAEDFVAGPGRVALTRKRGEPVNVCDTDDVFGGDQVRKQIREMFAPKGYEAGTKRRALVCSYTDFSAGCVRTLANALYATCLGQPSDKDLAAAFEEQLKRDGCTC